jgi:hypothetical protein
MTVLIGQSEHFEIGRILHLRSEILDFELDVNSR